MSIWIITLFFLEIIFFAFSVFNIFALEKARNPLYLLAPLVMTSVLGGILFFFAIYQMAGLMKVFLLLVGTAPAVMLISIIFHNVISGGITKLRKGKEFEEPLFFLIGVFVCPAAFMVGVIGAIVSLIKTLIAK